MDFAKDHRQPLDIGGFVEMGRRVSKSSLVPLPTCAVLGVLEQQSPTFLTTGTGFMEDNFSMDLGGGPEGGRGDGFRMIQVHYTYCALYFYSYEMHYTYCALYFYSYEISSTSDRQAILEVGDPCVREPCWLSVIKRGRENPHH